MRPLRETQFAIVVAFISALTCASVQAQGVHATADVGTADAGIASRPIANVAVNDFVGGNRAVLGDSGNATVSRSGTWPAGFALDSSTGAVTVAAAVPPGSHVMRYRLCDHSTPALCAGARVAVTVIVPSIIATPDVGSGIAGIASTPIANVASNDTVNGTPAILGPGGNASVAKYGTWPTGFAFDPSTGAVTIAITVPAGSNSIQYRLCDRNVPVVCSLATDSVTVQPHSVVAVAESGTSSYGAPSIAIANVTANDTVNGSPAALGSGGNATVAPVGAWQTGLQLDVSTGAVSSTGMLPVGSYSIQYQICDLNSPSSCGTATDFVTVSPNFTEVQVTAVAERDIEFDWGRDGVYCASCNYGQGNARFNWTDQSGNLWIGHLDPSNGAFTPTDGTNELADTSAFYFAVFSNGPEWAFSTQGGQVVSQLVYTRYVPGMPATASNAGAAYATLGPGGWTAEFFPGAMGTTAFGTNINTVLPQASQCNSDPVAMTAFNDLSIPSNVYTELTRDDPDTVPVLTPFGASANRVSGDKPAIHWVPCTHQLTFVGTAPPDGSGNVYHQVYWYDADSQALQPLTADAADHAEAFMFRAPEFSDQYVFYTIINGVEIDVYLQSGVDGSGAPIFQLVNRITSPDPAEPYINGTEPFIHCTPVCQSYIIMKLQPDVRTVANLSTLPNGLAVTNIDPSNPVFRILVPQQATPDVQRNDPEYYITANGPYLYYSRNVVASPTTPFQLQGRYFIDMGLGPPSGGCVGSSAQGGMVPGC